MPTSDQALQQVVLLKKEVSELRASQALHETPGGMELTAIDHHINKTRGMDNVAKAEADHERSAHRETLESLELSEQSVCCLCLYNYNGPHTGGHSNHWSSVNNQYVALCLYNYNGPPTGGGGGGGWNAIIYQILDPPKSQISDISRSQKSDIWLKKIRYQISHPLKNQISDIKVPPFHHPHTGRHSNHWNSVNNLYVALCLYNYNGPHTGRRSNHWNSCNV